MTADSLRVQPNDGWRQRKPLFAAGRHPFASPGPASLGETEQGAAQNRSMLPAFTASDASSPRATSSS